MSNCKRTRLWKEVWRSAVLSHPDDGKLVIVAAGTSVFKTIYSEEDGRYYRKTREGRQEITGVWGWIPVPSLLPNQGTEVPLEVSYRAVYDELVEVKRENEELKRQLNLY